MIEPLLLTMARVTTSDGNQRLTNASNFYGECEERLFLVTRRHVLADRPRRQAPNRIEIETHLDPNDVGRSGHFSTPLNEEKRSAWREHTDTSGPVDVAALEIEQATLPPNAPYRAIRPRRRADGYDRFEGGAALLVVKSPLGLHDTLHQMPVVRHAAIASSSGLRFRGEGYLSTDGRTHRGMSRVPVVARISVTKAAADLRSVSWA